MRPHRALREPATASTRRPSVGPEVSVSPGKEHRGVGAGARPKGRLALAETERARDRLGLSLARESKRVGVPLEPGRCSTNSH